MSTSVRAKVRQRADRRRPTLGVLQRLGRSLMLPIAALPVAAILLRLGQPDMLGAGDTGLALGRTGPGCDRSPRCSLRPAAPSSTTSGCCSPWESPSASPASPTAPRRWPRSSATWSSTRSPPPCRPRCCRWARRPRGRRAPDRLRGVRRDRGGRGRRPAVATVPPDLAADVPRLLRWPALRADRDRQRGAGARGGPVLRLPRLRHRADGTRSLAGGQRPARRGGVRVRQQVADPVRPAPPPQLGALVRGGQLHHGRRDRRCTGTSPGSSAATRRRACS